jgi:UDP-2,3-diacylglucosamine hydrolase
VGLPAHPLPVFWELEAPTSWQAIDFISDLHLQASHPKTLAAFEQHLQATDADAVMLLGDIFEAWVGDDAGLHGFEADVAEVLEAASSRVSLAFMAGNRDFLVGNAMLRRCGITALPDPTVLVAFGQRVLLTHGDALCIDDHAYQRFRTEVRTAHWRDAFLARPLAERQALARQMREASHEHQRSMDPKDWADVDPGTAVQWMHEAGTRVMVHGHTHRPGRQALAPGHWREVLSDWELDQTAARAEVLRLTREGFARFAPLHQPSPARP